MNLDQFQATIETVLGGVRKVIIGQDDPIRYSLVVILCNQLLIFQDIFYGYILTFTVTF